MVAYTLAIIRNKHLTIFKQPEYTYGLPHVNPAQPIYQEEAGKCGRCSK